MKIVRNKITRAAVIASAILFCIVTSLAPAMAYSYTTDSYDVDITVNKDNTYDITENISVNFNTPKHGIFRYIPVGNHKGMGYMTITDITVDGWNFETYSENGNKVIQIGDEDRTVTGEAVYPIKYKVKVYDDRDESRDFFYLDVIPTGWETPIDKASVRIKMPEKIDADKIKVYSGVYGSTMEMQVQWNYDEASDVITIQDENLNLGYGITVLCELPEGYWQGEATYGWAKTLAYAIAVILPLIVIVLWWFFGRDKKIVPTVEFYPPEGMTPAEVGYVIDSTINQKDLVSLLMYYADKGYLSIEQCGKKDFKITKLNDIDKGEKKFARTLFNGLFEAGDSVYLDELGEEFGDSYLTAYQQLGEYFGKEKNRQNSIKSLVFQILGIMFTAISQIAVLALGGWYSGEVMMIIGGVASSVVSIIVLVVLVIRNKKLYVLKRARKYIGGTLLWIIEGALVLGFSVLAGTMFDSLPFTVLAFILSAAAYICTVQMRQRTDKSVELMGKILGLKNFIETAELDRINMLVEENPDYYYNVLPYAYVMGLTDKWAKNFEGIAMTRPSWYTDSYGRADVFDIWIFSNMMNRCSRSFASNIQIPVGGDSGGGGGGFSSGGGGFSGGGFGGGGGGSW